MLADGSVWKHPRPVRTARKAVNPQARRVDDRGVDMVVMTWALYSISDPPAALHEMRRVLKLGGVLLFVEHGLSTEPGVARWELHGCSTLSDGLK